MIKQLIVMTSVVAMIGSGQTGTAQVRIGQGQGPQAPAGNRVQQQPAPSPGTTRNDGFRSTLELATPPPNTRRLPNPFRVRDSRLPFLDLIPFWYWDGTAAGYPRSSLRTDEVPRVGVPTGGLQLDVQPWRAKVYADGVYAGLVEDFRGYYRHLELGAGPHFIEIVTDDHEPLGIEVVITPGRTTTYRGTLSRYR